MLQWIQAHSIGLFICYLVFTAAVDRMPQPSLLPNRLWYQWLYGVLHDLAQLASMNISRVKFLPNVVNGNQKTEGKTTTSS